MKLLILLSFVLSILLGVGRGIDLAFFTDAETGLCLAGSVWLRYAALAAAVAVAVAAGRWGKPKPEALRSRCLPSGIVAAVGAVCFGAAGVLRIVWMHSSFVMLTRAMLELMCALWLVTLSLSWLLREWSAPTRSLVPAVLGSVVFYWCVLARFMENSSSWHRVAPTAMVWQLLSAVVFLAALVRCLYLPGTSDGRTLCAAGLTAFALCLCWEVPAVVQLAVCGTGLLNPELMFRLGLCCMGAMGGLSALRCVRTGPEEHTEGQDA